MRVMRSDLGEGKKVRAKKARETDRGVPSRLTRV